MRYRGDISPEEYAAMEEGYEQGRESVREALPDLSALADGWDGGEDVGIAHVVECQDPGCKQCVAIACATDLRRALRRGT